MEVFAQLVELTPSFDLAYVKKELVRLGFSEMMVRVDNMQSSQEAMDWLDKEEFETQVAALKYLRRTKTWIYEDMTAWLQTWARVYMTKVGELHEQ